MQNTVHGESFKEALKLRFSIASDAVVPSKWITENTHLKGRKYSFLNHEYQIAIADDKHRVVAAKKCAQIGFTEILIRAILCFLVQHQGSQGIFTQPTDAAVSDFAKSRVDPLFEDCPLVQRLGSGGVDSVRLKRIGTSFLNLRGTFGSKAAISVPSDINIYDEINFSNPRVRNQFKSRLQHSEYKFERAISTPTIPNYGVSELFNQSDRKVVMHKCPHCGHRQTLKWPGCIELRGPQRLRMSDPDAIAHLIAKPWAYTAHVFCAKCERDMDRSWRDRLAEWVAEFPDRAMDLDTGVSGYQIGQLDIPFVPVMDIVKASDKRLEGYKKTEDFHNFVLGEDYVNKDAQKIDDAVKELATLDTEQPNAASGTFIGVDLGSICHVVVLKDVWLPFSAEITPLVLATIKLKRDELEDGLPVIMKQYGCLYTVSDAQPFTTTVEKIAKNHPNKMAICFFGGKKAYTLTDIQVTANRTQMLDAVTERFPRKEMRCASGIADYDEFWKHCMALVKVAAEDDDGEIYYEYVKVDDDHFGLAAGYALLARRIWYEVRPGDGDTGYAPVEITGHRTNI